MRDISGSSDSEHGPDLTGEGWLFRLSARAGLLVFAGILGGELYYGGDPTEVLLRSLGALVVVTGCGWFGERLLLTRST